MISDNYNIKQCILDYAQNHEQFEINQLVTELKMKINTARQYLSALTKNKQIVRVGNGTYSLPNKQIFKFVPNDDLLKIHQELKAKFPFADFCIYDGSIFTTLQHHVSINHAIYVETNRDAVDSVFFQLKESYPYVYKQPNVDFMYNYVDLQEPCIIVKTYVTEAPVNNINGILTPTLEKILVDIQKDADFYYMQGIETTYMYQAAFDLYTINIQKMLRYAKRRGAYKSTFSLIEESKSYD